MPFVTEPGRRSSSSPARLGNPGKTYTTVKVPVSMAAPGLGFMGNAQMRNFKIPVGATLQVGPRMSVVRALKRDALHDMLAAAKIRNNRALAPIVYMSLLNRVGANVLGASSYRVIPGKKLGQFFLALKFAKGRNELMKENIKARIRKLIVERLLDLSYDADDGMRLIYNLV